MNNVLFVNDYVFHYLMVENKSTNEKTNYFHYVFLGIQMYRQSLELITWVLLL